MSEEYKLLNSMATAKTWMTGRIDQLGEAIARMTALVNDNPPTTAAEAAQVYITVKTLDEQLEETAKALGALKQHLQYTLVPARFSDEGISTITTLDGTRATISTLVRASIADKDRGYNWLRENGLGDLIVDTVNASTLSAVAKRMMEEGNELPDDLFTVRTVSNTSITAKRK